MCRGLHYIPLIINFTFMKLFLWLHHLSSSMRSLLLPYPELHFLKGRLLLFCLILFLVCLVDFHYLPLLFCLQPWLRCEQPSPYYISMCSLKNRGTENGPPFKPDTSHVSVVLHECFFFFLFYKDKDPWFFTLGLKHLHLSHVFKDFPIAILSLCVTQVLKLETWCQRPLSEFRPV